MGLEENYGIYMLVARLGFIPSEGGRLSASGDAAMLLRGPFLDYILLGYWLSNAAPCKITASHESHKCKIPVVQHK